MAQIVSYLFSHANASHFWLNEGWTTYIERVLQQFLHGPAERGFSFLIGSKALNDALKQYENVPKYQRLIIEFETGEDPDDAYSSIPYEKGANFILHLGPYNSCHFHVSSLTNVCLLERTLGGLDAFLPYVRDYVNTFMGQSITTEQWKSHLYGYYKEHGGEEKVKALDSVDWNVSCFPLSFGYAHRLIYLAQAWFYGEGLTLPVKMEYDMTLAKQAYALAEQWDASRSIPDISKLQFKKTDLDTFNSNQIGMPLIIQNSSYFNELQDAEYFCSCIPGTSTLLLRTTLCSDYSSRDPLRAIHDLQR